MTKGSLCRRVGAALLALSLAVPAAASDLPTVVIIQEGASQLNYLPARVRLGPINEGYYPPPQGYGAAGIVGHAIGGAMAQKILIDEATKAAQAKANERLELLTEPWGAPGFRPLVMDAFHAALAKRGMDQQSMSFTDALKLDPTMFQRMPTARGAKRFLLVRVGDMATGPVDLPIALHDTLRQLRIAVHIEVRGGRFDRSDRIARRDVVYYTDPLDVGDGEDVLATLAANDQALFRAQLAQAIDASLGMVMEDRDFPKRAEDEPLGALSDVGFTEFKGTLLAHEGGRALIWTRGGAYVSIPADRIITGEEMAAARAAEKSRRGEPVDDATLSDDAKGEPAKAVDGGAQAEEPATPVAVAEGAPAASGTEAGDGAAGPGPASPDASGIDAGDEVAKADGEPAEATPAPAEEDAGPSPPPPVADEG